jgi:hypothetical protein
MMINNLMHDFSVALLIACLFTMWVASRPAAGIPEESLRRLYRSLARVAAFCWIVIAAGGIVRLWGYREYEWLPAAGRGQLAALALKHAALFALVAAGLAGQIRLRRRFKA